MDTPITDRDILDAQEIARLAARCKRLEEALTQITVLAEFGTTGPTVSPCKSRSLTARAATALRGSISALARAALEGAWRD